MRLFNICFYLVSFSRVKFFSALLYAMILRLNLRLNLRPFLALTLRRDASVTSRVSVDYFVDRLGKREDSSPINNSIASVCNTVFLRAQILPHDARARRLFVTSGGLKKVQEIPPEPGTTLSECITIINSCFPEEIVRLPPLFYTASDVETRGLPGPRSPVILGSPRSPHVFSLHAERKTLVQTPRRSLSPSWRAT